MKNVYKFKKILALVPLLLLGVIANAQAPTVTTEQGSYLLTDGATLNGTVNPHGVLTTVTFEYGTVSGSLLSSIAASPNTSSSSSIINVSASLSSLNPGTFYYYRVKAENIYGTTYGRERFTKTFASGQYPYTFVAKNDKLIDPYTYEFDIYIYSNKSGSELLLSQYQIGFELWGVTPTGTDFTPTIVSGSSALPDVLKPTSFTIVKDPVYQHLDMTIRCTFTPGPNLTVPYRDPASVSDGTKVGTFRLLYLPGIYPQGALFNMVWDDDFTARSQVYDYRIALPETNNHSHQPYAIPGFPLNNYPCNAAVWNGTTDAWMTPSNWTLNPSTATITSPPGPATYTYIPGSRINNFPLVSTRIEPTCGALKIAAGGTLTISGDLTVNGTLTDTTTFNSLVINSGGSLIQSSPSVSATVKRDISGNWVAGTPPNSGNITHYVSSPISGGTINNFLGCQMNKWNESTSLWEQMTLPLTTPMVPGQGYSVAATAAFGTAVFTGTLNAGDQSIALTNRGGGGSTDYYGWNLVGNPFPCSLNWCIVTPPSGMDAAAYVWDQAFGNYKAATTVPGTFDGKIPAEQGFFVHVTTGLTFTIPAAARVHGTGYFKSATSMNEYIDLKVEGNNYADQTQIHFNPNASDGFDPEFDAYKLGGLETAPQLYSILPEANLTINTLPDISVSPIIKLGFTAGAAGSYKITTTGFQSFSNSPNLYIEDLLSSEVQDLKQNPVYTFTASPGQPEHRFNLHFAALGINDKETSNIKIYSNKNDIYVNIPDQLNGDIIVYNLLGVEVMRKPIISNSLNKLNLCSATGYYIVKVMGDNKTKTDKVLVN